MRSITRTLAAATLTFEALVVFFAALVAKDLSSLSAATALGGGAVIALACLLTAGLLRVRAGYLIGWGLQLVLIGTGAWVPMMFFIGALFTVLWAVSLYWGTRIMRERAIVAVGLASRGIGSLDQDADAQPPS